MNAGLVDPTNNKGGYIYGITGGTTYIDDGVGGETGTIKNISSVIGTAIGMATWAPDLVQLDEDQIKQLTDIKSKVDKIYTIIDDKTELAPDIGSAPIEGNAGLTLENYGHDWVRYYGAVGGDLSINTGLGGTVNAGAGSIFYPVLISSPEYTEVIREGNIINNLNSGSIIGGIGGNGALALGKIKVDLDDYTYSGATVDVNIVLNGETSNTLNGNVTTNVAKDTNVIGWMNGGLAAGIGGTATSTINGTTELIINGKDEDGNDRADYEGDYEGTGNDAVPQITTALNVMKGSKINAIGVMGGSTAASILGGEATSTVNGTSTIKVNNATVLGMIGGGAAASVDVTGPAEAIIGGQRGNDDMSADITGKQLEGWLNTKIPDNLTITATEAINGGTATSTTGDTYLNINGDSTVVAAIGGGVAAASHTYTYKGDKTAEGGEVNDAWGSSTATATTGRSHITVDLPDSQLKTGNGWSDISSAVGNFVDGIKHDSTQADSLKDLDGKGGVFGIFGGGVAVGHGSASSTLSGKSGAHATANTAGSDIDLKQGYAAAVFGGGAAVTDNMARAVSSMKDASDNEYRDVNIKTGGQMTTVGIFGGGLALSMEGSTSGYPADANEVLAYSDVGTVNITNKGNTDGIFGGGMAIGNSNRNYKNAEHNDAESSVQTSNITIENGTVSNLDMYAFMHALKNDNGEEGSGKEDWGTSPWWNRLGYNASGTMVDLKGIMDDTSIAAGGLGLGMTGKAEVGTAHVKINGGTIEKDILGGGIAVDNITGNDGEKSYGKGGAHVGTSIIDLNGGTVAGSVYAGGAVNGTTLGMENLPPVEGHTGYNTENTSSTVDTATVNLNGTSVTGEISGQGYKLTTKYSQEGNYNPYYDGNVVTYTKDTDGDNKADVYESVTDSTLNISGTNTLSALGDGDYTSASKIHDFDEVNVKAGSVTKVEGLTAGTGAALIDGGKVTVEDGAKLDVTGLEKTDAAYHIVANAAEDSTYWKNSNLVYDRTEGYAVGSKATGATYDVTYSELTEENAAAAAKDMVEALNAGPFESMIEDANRKQWAEAKGITAGGKQFFSDWSKDGTGAAYGRAAMIGEDAAVTGNTVSIARDMADNVMQRLSFTDDYVQDAGWVNNDGGIWAKYIHRKYETDNMGSSFGGIHSSTDYDGAIVGVDFAKHGNFQSGVAFHYGSGDGNGLISRNDYDAWGFTLYGSLKDEEAGTNLMADVGYVTSDNDIDGTVNGKSLSADRDVDAWTIGLRGEKEYVFGQNQLVPYVGLRYMSVNPARYSVYYDGAKAFNADADNQNLWLLPIGVSFRNETVTDGGWRITPKLDLSYIWAFGDTDTDMTLDMGGVGSGLYYDVMDDNSWLASLGVEATKDVWSFGVGYGYQKGDDTKNKTWFVNASYAF